MRCRPILVVSGLLLAAASVRAQTYPAEMAITVPEVEVRSGPADKYYATSKLYRGAKVKVLGESDQKGWLKIAPPPGSFSWIDQKYVEIQPSGTGVIISDADAPILPGSSLTNKQPDYEQVKVKKGTQVFIVDRPEKTSTFTWLAIAPHVTEVRFIPANAVDSTQFARNPATPATGTVPGTLTGFSRNQTPGQAGWQPGATPTGNAPTTAAYNTGPQAAPQWSVWGTLRNTAFQTDDGRPMYVLEDARRQPVLYVAAPSGLSLRNYLGKNVSLFGPINYNSNLRTSFMTASYVAVP